ncbi:MAG: hypothetical protein HQ592_14300 [Planctomycetes bacterium]|nr:hypothetical protein [Planctomycetota bacterium]
MTLDRSHLQYLGVGDPEKLAAKLREALTEDESVPDYVWFAGGISSFTCAAPVPSEIAEKELTEQFDSGSGSEGEDLRVYLPDRHLMVSIPTGEPTTEYEPGAAYKIHEEVLRVAGRWDKRFFFRGSRVRTVGVDETIPDGFLIVSAGMRERFDGVKLFAEELKRQGDCFTECLFEGISTVTRACRCALAKSVKQGDQRCDSSRSGGVVLFKIQLDGWVEDREEEIEACVRDEEAAEQKAADTSVAGKKAEAGNQNCNGGQGEQRVKEPHMPSQDLPTDTTGMGAGANVCLRIDRIRLKPLDEAMARKVADEVDDLVQLPQNRKRFRDQTATCARMVVRYEQAEADRWERIRQWREALRTKYAGDIERIKTDRRYREGERPDDGYEWMVFLGPLEDSTPGDVCGWVMVLDDDDLKSEDELFPVADLPPRPFPAPELFITGQTDDPRPPRVDEDGACEYLPGYYWMLAVIHDKYERQRPRIIEKRIDLPQSLLLQLKYDMMLKSHPFTYEHVGHALDVRADLKRIGKGTAAQPTAPNQIGNLEADAVCVREQVEEAKKEVERVSAMNQDRTDPVKARKYWADWKLGWFDSQFKLQRPTGSKRTVPLKSHLTSHQHNVLKILFNHLVASGSFTHQELAEARQKAHGRNWHGKCDRKCRGTNRSFVSKLNAAIRKAIGHLDAPVALRFDEASRGYAPYFNIDRYSSQ